MEHLLYEFRPFIFYAMGFFSGQLDHPVKWVSVIMFLLASVMIMKMRYISRGSRTY